MLAAVICSSEKPHFHNGVLPPYDGKPIQVVVNAEQQQILDKEQPVCFPVLFFIGLMKFQVATKEMVGKSGRGIVIQDIRAATTTCMSKIRDLANYTKMVPHLKVCDVYDTQSFNNVCDAIDSAILR